MRLRNINFNFRFSVCDINTFFFIFVAFNVAYATEEDRPIVTTPNGQVKGLYQNSFNGRIYSAFYGIPFAKPPVGDLRFADPQAPEKWDGIWEANFTTCCLQILQTLEPDTGVLTGQEDCLYLNVFIPRKNATEGKLLNVVLEIPAGALSFGGLCECLGAEFVMDKEVILVTINYRLGPLGFLSTEDEVVSGNAGMKDQVAAIKWVKNNIQSFGGNPEEITLTGVSAGGLSVHFHYLSPLSKGLFKQGISMSGTALHDWGIQNEALVKAKALASAVGCPEEPSTRMINCLRQRPGAQILENLHIFRPYKVFPLTPFSLVVEKNIENAFLHEHPYALMSRGEIYDVPWICSTVQEEGVYPSADLFNNLDVLESRWDELAPIFLNYNFTVSADLKPSVTEQIKAHYFGDEPICRGSFQNLTKLFGDRMFTMGITKAVKLQAVKNKSPVYFSLFSYNGEGIVSSGTFLSGTTEYFGVGHGDDFSYVLSREGNTLSQMDAQMKDIFMNIWDTYSKTGNPNYGAFEWNAVTKDPDAPINYLHMISPTELVMESKEDFCDTSFWESLPIQENEKLFNNI